MALMIFLIFIIGSIFTAVKRVKLSDYELNARESTVGAVAIKFGYFISLILAILLMNSMSEIKDPKAIYYINGIIVKGGTNWMIIILTFLFGGGFILLLIQFVSAFIARLIYFLNIGNCQKWSKLNIKKQDGKSKTVALVLACIPTTGILGIDRFYLGYVKMGFLKMFTFGGFGVLWIMDIVKIANGNMTDSQGRELI